MSGREFDDVRPAPGPEVAREEDVDDALGRSEDERYDTPRRYEVDEAGSDVSPDARPRH